jgi:hypothetical protein
MEAEESTDRRVGPLRSLPGDGVLESSGDLTSKAQGDVSEGHTKVFPYC